MPGMQRFVSYLYLYENEEKAGNVGFAKIELRGEECRIEVHLRGTYTNNVSCKIYLFTESGDFIQGVPIGVMKIQNGTGDFGTIMKANQIAETNLAFADMNGLLIFCEDERLFATRWKNGKEIPFSERTFKVWEPPQFGNPEYNEEALRPEAGQEAAPATTDRAQSENESVQQWPTDLPQTDREQTEADTRQEFSQQETEEENMQATEVPMHNIFPQLVWEEQWEKLKKDHPVFTPFTNKMISCMRIELKDLRELPKRYWYLGNNSFLLHGFFNYHYIVLGSVKTGNHEKWFLGIPGIYQNQERVMAAIFGFPEFMAASDEKEPVNQFGYWYRMMDE